MLRSMTKQYIKNSVLVADSFSYEPSVRHTNGNTGRYNSFRRGRMK